MNEPPLSSRSPEKEFLVVRGGKVCVWLQKDGSGRTVSISPPRYKDQSGNWRDGNFFISDLAMLQYAVSQALDFCYHTPIGSLDNDPAPPM